MRRADLAIAGGLIALGGLFAVQTVTLPDAPGYAQVGPRLFPGLIAAGLIACGLGLGRAAFAGAASKSPQAPLYPSGFAWVSAGVVAHMVAIGYVGFIIAATVLFACVARGFGSDRPLRDVCIGAAVATVTFIGFVFGIGVTLPSGWPTGAS